MRGGKVLAGVGLVAALAVLGRIGVARSADFGDGPKTTAVPAADLGNLYTWIDGNDLALAMTVFPAATTDAKFATDVQYVFHTSSGAAYGQTTSNVDVICTFDAAQKISCWVGLAVYVTGDASTKTGLSSADGKFTVFAGLRADPFFFNLVGFQSAAEAYAVSKDNFQSDPSGCPWLDFGAAGSLRTTLMTSAGAPAVDTYKNLNTLAIVVKIDKSLVTLGGPFVSAWASTNKAQTSTGGDQ